MAGPCKNCGAAVAPFGYRRRGSLSQLPPDKQTMVFACENAACRTRAEEWKRKADGEDVFSRRSDPPPAPAPPKKKPDPAQGSLF